jgi:hypothetical protein
MRDALRATGLKTKRETLELGLHTLLRLKKQAEIRRLRGKLEWQGDLDAMRLTIDPGGFQHEDRSPQGPATAQTERPRLDP